MWCLLQFIILLFVMSHLIEMKLYYDRVINPSWTKTRQDTTRKMKPSQITSYQEDESVFVAMNIQGFCPNKQLLLFRTVLFCALKIYTHCIVECLYTEEIQQKSDGVKLEKQSQLKIHWVDSSILVLKQNHLNIATFWIKGDFHFYFCSKKPIYVCSI